MGLLPDPSIFHEDGGYDFDYNCGILLKMGMIPNIKQRMTAVNRGKPNRSRAAKFFDKDECKQRGMIEGIFWGGVQAPPTILRAHPLGQPLPFRQDPGHRLDPKVLNHLRYARMLGIEIPSCSGMVCRCRNVCASV